MSTLNGGPGNIVTNGLVLYLDAANANSYTNGSTVWKDLTYFNSTGSLINSPTYNSGNAGSIQFDGIDDYVLMNPNVAPTGNEITIGVWNYGVNRKRSSILYCAGSTERIINVHLPWTDSRVYWDCGGNGSIGGNYDRINTAVLNSNQWQNSWHYWAFTKNASTGIMRIYLDGVLNVEGSSKTLQIGVPTTFYIALYAPSDYHSGWISNINLYNRALSAAEILQNYNSTKARFGL